LHSIVDSLVSDFVDDLETATALLATNIVGPLEPDTSGIAFANPTIYVWPLAKQEYEQVLTKLEVGVSTAGTFKLFVLRHENDNTLTLVSSQPVNFAGTGALDIDDLDVLVPAGCVVGLQCNTGATYYTAGATPGGASLWYILDGNVGNHTPYTVAAANAPHWRITLNGEISGKARVAYDQVQELAASIGQTIVLGWPSPVSTGTDVPGGYSIIFPTPALADGYFTRARVGVDLPGSADLIVCEVSGGLVVTVLSATTVSLAPGVNTIDLQVPIAAGQYVGIRGGNYKFQNAVNPQGIAVWAKGSAVQSGDTVVLGSQHRFEVELTVATGLFATADGGGAVGTGLDVLAQADSTGGSDSTGDFADARGSHPFPYVRPGTFAVTALPATGGGFWGPGKINLNGDRFFIPEAPQGGNLFDRFRSRLADVIADDDVIALMADSIGHFATAPSGPEHWFNLVCRFANAGIAKDEPIMTALRPSSTYTPAFYGVTTAGTVSTGTNGPIGESLILGAGASLSFTGAYEQVDVFYTRAAGAGTLAFSFNGGAAYKNVVAAGANALDLFTGPSLTAQAGSGTYTITATGGPVEITGLVRLGIKAAGSRKRLRFGRFAHGSWTFGSFQGAPVQSIVKQSQYAGGKAVLVSALGTNDMFGSDPAAFVATAKTVIDAAIAGGVEKLVGIIPSRMGPSWNSIFTGGRSYDEAVGPLLRMYLDYGALLVRLDDRDWTGEGLQADQLHPNGPGQHPYALDFVRDIANGYAPWVGA
jgi:hypothetical protein